MKGSAKDSPDWRPLVRRLAIDWLAWIATTFVVMAACKLVCILSITRTDTGSEILASETTAVAVASWFADDLLAGLIWATVVGLPLVMSRSRLGTRISLAIGVLLGVALGLFMTVGVTVYDLFGVPPSLDLLDSLEGGTDAVDSVQSFLSLSRVSLWIGLAALFIVGPRLLSRVLEQRRDVRVGLASLLAALFLVTSIASWVRAPGALGLEDNALLAFARSAVLDEDEPELPPVKAELAEVLEPVMAREEEDVPLLAYRQLQRWASTRRPNVVLIVLESTSSKHMHVTGGESDNTPILDDMAQRAIVWPWHFAHSPRSMTSLYSILCSNFLKPFSKPITSNRPRIDCRSISEVLSDYGYRAGLFHSGTFRFTRKDAFLRDRSYSPLYDAINLPGSGQKYQRSSWGIEEDASVDALLSWVAENKDRRFFATYIPVYPHHPYDVPVKGYETPGGGGSVAKYEQAVRYVDDRVGRILAGVRELGLESNTLFVVVGDHGEAFGEHPSSKVHGGRLYDEQVRTFAMWYAPGALKRRIEDSRSFGHVDLAATLLDLLRIRKPDQHVGVSALAAGKRPLIPLYLSNGFHQQGFVDGHWKYIFDNRSKRSELYDLRTDPVERKSLAKDRSDAIEQYRARLGMFTAAQVEWEKSIADLSPSSPPHVALDGTRTLTLRPSECSWSPELFELAHGELLLVQVHESATVICEAALPWHALSGRLTRLTARGVESARSSTIHVSLLWVSSNGEARILAETSINGTPDAPIFEQDGKIEEIASFFGPGGAFRLSIRYTFEGRRTELSRETFRLDEVEVEYQHDHKELLDAVDRMTRTMRGAYQKSLQTLLGSLAPSPSSPQSTRSTQSGK